MYDNTIFRILSGIFYEFSLVLTFYFSLNQDRFLNLDKSAVHCLIMILKQFSDLNKT